RVRSPGVHELLAVRELVDAISLPAVAALDEWIREVLDVPRGFPNLRVHEDGGVEAHHVLAQLDHGAPPRTLHVVLELDAERSVVPGRARAAVDLARREYESPPFR